MDLYEALDQLSEIRVQMARTETFRGYRSATAAFSGMVAIAAATIQSAVVSDPAADPRGYLLLWVAAAILSVAVTGTVFGGDGLVRHFRKKSWPAISTSDRQTLADSPTRGSSESCTKRPAWECSHR